MIYAPLGANDMHFVHDIRFAYDIFVTQICRMLSLFRFALKNFYNRSVATLHICLGKYIIHHIADISYPQRGYIIIESISINHNLTSLQLSQVFRETAIFYETLLTNTSYKCSM